MKHFKISRLIFWFLITQVTLASVITVDNDCSLTNAIESANSNTAVGMCVAGDDVGDPDTIQLTVDVVLSTAFEDHAQFGRTGTPAISSNIVLNI